MVYGNTFSFIILQTIEMRTGLGIKFAEFYLRLNTGIFFRMSGQMLDIWPDAGYPAGHLK